MLRNLVQARDGTSAQQLEAVTAERDFFREKFAEQMNVMEHLKGQLKESQRVIHKLRSEILDLETGKSSLMEQVGGAKQIESSGGSTNSSVTCLTCDDDVTTKSGVENNAETANEEADGCVAEDSSASSINAKEAEEKERDPDVDSLEDDDRSTHSEESGEEEEEESGSEDDEADDIANIRANAAKMLLWANYQTSKPRTPNTSMIQESADGLDDEDETETESRFNTPSKMGVSDAIVYSLPASLDKRQLMLDDDSSLGSSSRHHPERSDRASSGKIGNLFNNLKDMIDPPSESDSGGESDDESW
mmetsp:Transcript_5920/g.10597  ORF Transcript_5920/g.10597 Transcript_5920/m.10597 type:complete len:305 (-) Transcript_5920:157-1071(-)|eukprot:CAMPEP_0201890550 /NCGR_PEP_ID=MMETSP0902-20130614/32459_1 /ASSEMBLY_ACC=CAM_ASM_000551 /TAXON_ID=420261 /ORGANISM="Thalassiosira antarctica, Strain CCMP982" /LENGTH=304 /DNA_ID=CAMNT_0048421439 /DNA_START=68 /DNA_END=982 /DNA_ORIENTATION=-